NSLRVALGKPDQAGLARRVTAGEYARDCVLAVVVLQTHRALRQVQRLHLSIASKRHRFALIEFMAGPGSSMLYSFLLFTVILSLQQMYRGKLASTELFTILGGFISSLLFLVLFTFIGNLQETSGVRTGWGAVIIAEAVALIAAGTVHRVCITTCRITV
ncbi:hypothetical protein Prudu_004169, partial [Prunus dulcis]